MNYFSYKVELFKLNRQRDKVNKFYWKKFEEVKSTGTHEKLGEVGSEATSELQFIDNKIHDLNSRYLISVAEKMLVPIPSITEDNGLWEQSQFTRKWKLTNEGITELRGLIRKERKERLQLIIPFGSILIGLIGAITGLIAVIMR